MDANCPFCRKLAGLDFFPPEEVVWQFPTSVAVLGHWQYYHGYCVLIARRHASELSQLTDAERLAYLDEMCLLARAIETVFNPRKLNYELLGNLVPHLHWHVFPRYEQDPEHLKPVWVALDRADRDPSEKTRLQTPSDGVERATTIARLRQQLAQLTGTAP